MPSRFPIPRFNANRPPIHPVWWWVLVYNVVQIADGLLNLVLWPFGYECRWYEDVLEWACRQRSTRSRPKIIEQSESPFRSTSLADDGHDDDSNVG